MKFEITGTEIEVMDVMNMQETKLRINPIDVHQSKPLLLSSLEVAADGDGGPSGGGGDGGDDGGGDGSSGGSSGPALVVFSHRELRTNRLRVAVLVCPTMESATELSKFVMLAKKLAQIQLRTQKANDP